MAVKNYYSWIDTAFVKYVPQPLQHLAAHNHASKIGGKIVFYNAEDFETLATHAVMNRDRYGSQYGIRCHQ